MIPYPLKGGIVSYTPLSTVFYRELARARPRTSLAPFRFNVFAAMAMVLPDVKMSSQRCPYLIQYNDSYSFEHGGVQNYNYTTLNSSQILSSITIIKF